MWINVFVTVLKFAIVSTTSNNKIKQNYQQNNSNKPTLKYIHQFVNSILEIQCNLLDVKIIGLLIKSVYFYTVSFLFDLV